MSLDYQILATLSNPLIKEILHTIVKKKSVEFRQLASNTVDQNEALQALEILKQAELIKETSSPIDAFKTYYVTASGLQADRLIKG
jgi:DNA-binding transcriptional ArsR family regulator